MVAKNDITGDSIQTKHSTKAYEEGIDRIFDAEAKRLAKAKEKEEYFKKLNDETQARINNTGTNKNEYQDVLQTEDCIDIDPDNPDKD